MTKLSSLAVGLLLCACNLREVASDPVGAAADAAAEAIRGPTPPTRVCLLESEGGAVCLKARPSAALDEVCNHHSIDGWSVPGGCAPPGPTDVSCSGMLSSSESFEVLYLGTNIQALCDVLRNATGDTSPTCSTERDGPTQPCATAPRM